MNRKEKQKFIRLIDTWQRLSDYAEKKGDDRLAEGLRYCARSLETQVDHARKVTKKKSALGLKRQQRKKT